MDNLLQEKVSVSNFLTLENVTKEYKTTAGGVKAIDGVSFSLAEGEFVVILGPSGAGKTTLLNLLGGMDSATGGKIVLDGKTISNFSTQYIL